MHGSTVLLTISSTRRAAPGATGRWPPTSTRPRRRSASTRGERVLRHLGRGRFGGHGGAPPRHRRRSGFGLRRHRVCCAKGERAQVEASLTDGLGFRSSPPMPAPIFSAPRRRDRPEAKRKAIGGVHRRLPARGAVSAGVKFLAQGRSIRTSSNRRRCADRRRSSSPITTSAVCPNGSASSSSNRCAGCSGRSPAARPRARPAGEFIGATRSRVPASRCAFSAR